MAFDKLSTRDGLAKHPELDGAYKMLHDAHKAGQDTAYLRAEVSKQLHQGRPVGGGVTLDESQRVIDHAAAYRGLMVRDAEWLGGQFKGEVAAVSSHHATLQVGDIVAVRYERADLDRGLSVGDRVTIHYDQARSQVYEQAKEPARDRGVRDMQMERVLASGHHFERRQAMKQVAQAVGAALTPVELRAWRAKYRHHLGKH